jgi:hypothetical protein
LVVSYLDNSQHLDTHAERKPVPDAAAHSLQYTLPLKGISLSGYTYLPKVKGRGDTDTDTWGGGGYGISIDYYLKNCEEH